MIINVQFFSSGVKFFFLFPHSAIGKRDITCNKNLRRTIGRLEGLVNEVSCGLEVDVQVKVRRVVCRNATIHKAAAVEALVPFAASLGVSGV